MINETDEYIKEMPFYGHLKEEEKEYLRNGAVIRNVSKGEILYGRGNSCLGMSHIISGKIRVYIVSEEGREITLYTIEKGETCVLSASCVISQLTFETVMEAEEDSQLMIIGAGVFERVAEANIYVKEFMYEQATERFSQVMWVMQEILFKSFDRRLAGFLVSESERTGKTEIRMTQEQIARNVNSAREVVARMLKHFANEGMIELKHGRVILKDIEGLRGISG